MSEKAGAHCCSEHCRSRHCRHAYTDRKEGVRQKISHLALYFKCQFCSGSIASRQQFCSCSGFIASRRQFCSCFRSIAGKSQFCSRSIAGKSQLCSGFIAGKSQLPLRIDCKQTSVLLRLLVVVQRATCGEVVDLALDVLQNCLVLFGTFLGDTVDNIGVLCDG